MAFDAILHFISPSVTGGIWPKGESQWFEDGIPLTDEWSFSLENKLNITQHTAGAGAGKAEFEAFTIKKQVDKASPQLLMACGSGSHFNGVSLCIFKSGGQTMNQLSNLYLAWTFNQLAVEKIEWAFGDPAPEETVTFKFGACNISYGKQDGQGKITPAGMGAWNAIQNNMNFIGKIQGAKPALQITG